MKKLLTLIVAIAMMISLVACQNESGSQESTTTTSNEDSGTSTDEVSEDSSAMTTASGLPLIAKEDIKIGFIYSSTVGDEGYTYAHDLGRQALEDAGYETLYVENVPETSDCAKAAKDLIEQGCNVIYATSYGFGTWISEVADEYPDVYFNHATGDITKTNMATYMGRNYEPQYLAGIAAGMKTETNQIGYVTTFPIPEVLRQVDAFTLGVRSVNPEATVEVKWTSSWYDPVAEKSASTELLNSGSDVISAYCDTMNPQIAAADAGAYAIGCNTPGYDIIPDAYITAPIVDWATFYTENVQEIVDGTWTGNSQWFGLDSGVVALDDISENAAEGTEEAVNSAMEAIEDGSLDIFAGPIKDNDGNLQVQDGESLSDEELLSLDFFVEGVIGSVE